MIWINTKKNERLNCDHVLVRLLLFQQYKKRQDNFSHQGVSISKNKFSFLYSYMSHTAVVWKSRTSQEDSSQATISESLILMTLLMELTLILEGVRR